ncbi:MAG: SAM hydroxide adenosyltransferase [Candidatus Paceibacterota bacterium]
MQISVINDCFDEDARIRQISRAGSLFQGASVNCFAVRSELEAAGLLVDALDAFEDREGVILLNVAPRNGEAKKWKNGTPFGYFWHKRTLVVSSVDGLVLSLCKKLNLIKEFYLLDIEDVLDFISVEEMAIETKERIAKTQFRSFDFLPRVADWVWRKYDLPRHLYDLSEIKDISDSVWFVDNFGNIKTTLVGEDYAFQNGEKVSVSLGGKKRKMEFYERLKDLPDKQIGIVQGSSGIGRKRFLEIIHQGDNVAKKFGIESGDSVKI